MQSVSDLAVTKLTQGNFPLSLFRRRSRLGLATLSLLGREDGPRGALALLQRSWLIGSFVGIWCRFMGPGVNFPIPVLRLVPSMVENGSGSSAVLKHFTVCFLAITETMGAPHRTSCGAPKLPGTGIIATKIRTRFTVCFLAMTETMGAGRAQA